jgi:hypothetical protein
MPRPKSEMTSVARTVSARLIPAHLAEWHRLGGIKWLRQQLSESMRAELQRQNPSIAQRVINAIKLK